MKRENFVSRNLFRMALLLLTDLPSLLVKSRATRRRIMGTFFCKMILVIFVFALHISLCSAGEMPSDIRNAAEDGIRIFLQDPRMTGLQRLGFESQSDIDNVAIGIWFQTFIVHSDKLLNGSDSQDFQPLATPTDQWEILVVAGKKANALLTVDFVDGKWMPVGIGAPGLAKKLGNILEAWPASSGYQYRLICLYQISEKFIELSQGGKMIGLIPLVSSNATMGEPQKEFDPANIRDAKEVLINLWSSVLRDIQRGK